MPGGSSRRTSPRPGRTPATFPASRRRRSSPSTRPGPTLGRPASTPTTSRSGAPPEELGRSDFLLEHDEALVDRKEHEAALDDDEAARLAEEEEAYEEIEDWEIDDPDADAAAAGAGEAGYAVRGRRGREAHEAHKDRPRVIQFLIAVWAELQRVQWPNRQALVTLTGVVLGFVLIAGGYLGLLDAIFSELIKQIL